ncbi:MAG: GLPGLI family protein [Candidatus Sericytochromatia bacterium]
MKKIILSLFLTLNLVVAQNNKATYNVKLLDDSKIEKGELGYLYSKSKQEANNFVFHLLFSNRNANFFLEENLSVENLTFSSVKLFSRYKGFIYTDSLFNYIEKNIDFKRNTLKNKINRDWKLTNESKLIQNYLCYKATSKETITNSKGEFQFDIIAWYCPEIPYQFGPNGFGGLPGLILELQFDKSLYGLKTLTLNDKSIKIETVDQNKIISDEEYAKKIQEMKKSMFE